MKIALIATDNREQHQRYELEEPYFEPAITALLDGFASLGRNIEVHVVSSAKRAMKSPPTLKSGARFHSLRVPPIGWGKTAFAGCILATRRFLTALKPELVHGQGTERDCAMCAVHSGFPNLITIHGNMRRIHEMGLLGAPLYYRLAAALEDHALGRTSGTICNSVHTETLVRNRTRRTWLVPNPLRSAFFSPRSAPRESGRIPTFITIGVVTNLKRPLQILGVARKLHEKGYPVLFRFAGLNTLQDEYGMRFAAELEHGTAHGYAEFLGQFGENELIAAMDESDACVHFPSEEAFGLVVAECLARGLKMFASDVGGIRDIVKGVDGAELFENPEGLERGIIAWLEAGTPAPAPALDLMRSRYSPEGIASEHLRIYQEVLGKRRV